MTTIFEINKQGNTKSRPWVSRDLFDEDSSSDVIAKSLPAAKQINRALKYINTPEQEEIILSDLEGVTTVVAYAGTGKTSTLVDFANRHTNVRGLYLAFNKAIQMEGSKRFPRSIVCKTSHSIAFAAFGSKYTHKIKLDLRLTEIIDILGMPRNFGLARLVKNTVLGYCCSDMIAFPVTAIAPDHIPTGTEMELALAPKYAKRLWDHMCDVGHPAPMLHDGYLKLFQLSGAQVGFDFILFDEAQDANPVTTAIVKAQQCPVVVVGDPYQSIYGFRGAKNGLDEFNSDRTFYLTNSFRFGPKVAEIASELLYYLHDEKRPLVGRGFNTEICTLEDNEPAALICRTNAEVFDSAVTALLQNESMAFVGGVTGYGFEKILDAYYLFSGEISNIKDNHIRSFGNYVDFSVYAEESADAEARRLVAVVNTHMDKIPELVSAIYEKAIPNLQLAHNVFTTAHKSKGLEFKSVILANDFMELTKNNSPITDRNELPVQEINLTYVSVTRAIEKLQMNNMVKNFMKCVDF